MEEVIGGGDVLSSKDLVVHEEKIDILWVVDEERLVAAGHHVSGSLVASVSDLFQGSC